MSASFCRVCASSEVNNLIDIFGPDGAKFDALKKIHTYLPIEVTETDLLPLTICLPCVCILESCHIFKSKCCETTGILKSLYQRNLVKRDLCRLCATVNNKFNMIDMFSEKALEHDILSKVLTHLSIKVTENDVLPHRLCEDCFEKLSTYHNFIETCVLAHFRLTDMLELSHLINEDVKEEFTDTEEVHCAITEDNQETENIPKITEVKSISSLEYNVGANIDISQNSPESQLVQTKTSNTTNLTKQNSSVNLEKYIVIGNSLKPVENVSQNKTPILVTQQPQYILAGGKLVPIKLAVSLPKKVTETVKATAVNEPKYVIPIIQPNTLSNVSKTSTAAQINGSKLKVKRIVKTFTLKPAYASENVNSVSKTKFGKTLPIILSRKPAAAQTSDDKFNTKEIRAVDITSTNVKENMQSADKAKSVKAVEIGMLNTSMPVVSESEFQFGKDTDSHSSSSLNSVTDCILVEPEKTSNTGNFTVANTSQQTAIENEEQSEKSSKNTTNECQIDHDTFDTELVTETIQTDTYTPQESILVENVERENDPENADFITLIDSYNNILESREELQASKRVEKDVSTDETVKKYKNVSISDQNELETVVKVSDPLGNVTYDETISAAAQENPETEKVTKTICPVVNTNSKCISGENNFEHEKIMENMDLITLLESDSTVLEFTDEFQVSEQTKGSAATSNITVKNNKTLSVSPQSDLKIATNVDNPPSNELSKSVSDMNNLKHKKVTENNNPIRVRDIIDLTGESRDLNQDERNAFATNISVTHINGKKGNTGMVDGILPTKHLLKNVSNLPVKWNMLQNSLAETQQMDNKKYKVIMVKPGDKSKKLTYKDVMNIVKKDHELLIYKDKRGRPSTKKSLCDEFSMPDDDSSTIPSSSSKKKSTEVTTKPFYRCVYCDETLMGNEKLLAHQTSVHKDKVFVCTLCEPNLVFYESKHFFAQHMSSQHPESRNSDAESCKQPSVGNLTTQIKQPPNTVYIPNSLSVSVSTTEEPSHSNETATSNVHLDGRANETVSTSFSKKGEKTVFNKKGEKTVFNIDVPEKSEQNCKLSLKVSSRFKDMKRDVQSKIIETLTDIMNKSQTECFDKETEIETAHDDNHVPEDDNHVPEDDNHVPEDDNHEDDNHVPEEDNNKDKTELQDNKHVHDEYIIDGMEVVRKGMYVFPDGMKKPLQNKNFLNKLLKAARLTCPRCGKKFRDHNAWFKKHKESCTGVNLCQICGKILNNKKLFDKHMSRHAKAKTECPKSTEFVCETCGKILDGKKRLYSHRQACHRKKNGPFTCDKCGRVFKHKVSLTYHSPCHAGADYLCEICGKSIKYRNSYVKHLRTHADPVIPKPHVCQTCGKSFRSRFNLKEHTYIHTNERPYICGICSRNFRKLSSLRGHETVHSNILKHKCKICGKYFRRQAYLIGHMKLHRRAGAKVNVCKVCDKNFETAEVLADHLSTHSAEEIEQLKFDKEQDMHICQICGNEIHGMAQLRSHLQTHDIKAYSRFTLQTKKNHKGYTPLAERNEKGAKVFMCDECGKSFGSKFHYDIHYRIHTGEKPFKCSHCHKSFRSKVLLQVHIRVHTGEQPYTCQYCDKSFYSKSGVLQHEIIHSNKRPFECNACEKAFRRQDALNAHVRTHTGERPFACKVCGQRFTQGGDCRKHERRHLQGIIEAVSRPKKLNILRKRLKPDSSSSGDTSSEDENTSHNSVQVKQVPPIYNLPCIHCDKQFQSVEVLKQHVSLIHGYSSSYTFNIVKNPDCLTESVREIIIGNSHIE